MGTIRVLISAGIIPQMKRPWLSVHGIWQKNVLLWKVARPTQTLLFPKQLARVRKQRERKISDTGQRRVHLV